MKRLFTSELVTEVHTSGMADPISDTVLDANIDDSPGSRVAVGTFLTTGLRLVSGAVITNTWVAIPDLVRSTVLDIGYDSSDPRYDGASCGVAIDIGKQAPDIATGVEDADMLASAIEG
jgi:S-adenosylmethionine synthetase